MRGSRRRGSVLLEALIALVLLATSGAALVAVVGQTRRTIATVEASEQRTRAAAAQLSRLAVLDASELAGMTGGRHIHGWWLRLDRVTDRLFRIRIAESDTGVVVLETMVYRADTTRAAAP